MRKGYLLVELLGVMALMIMVTLVLDSLFVNLTRDIPRSHRMLEENNYLQGILVQLEADIDGAHSIYQDPEASEPNAIFQAPIVIELDDITVSYLQEEDGIVRRTLEPALPIPSDPNEPNPNQRKWPLNYGRLKWKVWMRDNEGCAVEVQTYMEHSVSGTKKKSLANSRVFFSGANPGAGIR